MNDSSVIEMIDDDLIFGDVVVPSNNFNFKKYRLAHKNKDGSNFTQSDCAKLLKLSDDKIISKFERNDSRIDDRTYSMFLLITGNHPEYTLEIKSDTKISNPPLIIDAPAPEDIKSTRLAIKGLQQNQASKLLGLHFKMYGKYETTTADIKHQRRPSPHTWTLFLLLTKLHPYYKLAYKR